MKMHVAVPLLLALAAPAMASGPQANTVTIDKETGEFRAPTTAELAELEAEAARMERARALEKSSGPRPVNAPYVSPKDEAEAQATLKVRPDGLVSIEVPETLHSRVVATIGEDGEVVIRHEGEQAHGGHGGNTEGLPNE